MSDPYIQRVIEEAIGEAQTSLTNCLEEVINPVNYRATVAFSMMDLMFRYLQRDQGFFDFLQAEMAISESVPDRVEEVYEWLQRTKGPDGSVQGHTGRDDSGGDE